jgi:hypothetical protein
MPAEWEPHEGTWLQWPGNKVGPGYEMKQEHTWLKMIAALHRHETVHIITGDERQRDHVAYQLNYFDIGPKGIDLHIIPTDDLWARDNGPIFVLNRRNELLITDWTFNGWGDRFDYELDNQVPVIIGHIPDEISVGGNTYQHAWQIVQQGHAVANACYVAAINRVGIEENSEGKKGINFWGQSFISDPYGQILAKAAGDREEVVVCPIDLAFIKRVRDCSCFPFRDPRAESYRDITKLYIDD